MDRAVARRFAPEAPRTAKARRCHKHGGRRSRAERERAVAAALVDQDRRLSARDAFAAGHSHTCVTPTCRKRFECASACEPSSDDANNSICPACFEAVAIQPCARKK